MAKQLNDKQLLELARIAVPGIETLERRMRDQFDFHEVSVWGLEKALRAAYELGRSGKKGKA